jgi:hypothetical protein
MLAAGCSTSGTSNVATVPNTTSAQTTSHGNADLQVANWLVKLPARPANTGHGWLSPGLRAFSPGDESTLIYWANFYNSAIDVFAPEGSSPKMKGQITNGVSLPQRLFVDADSNVYATNVGNNTITVYKTANRPFLTISNGVFGPTGLTVDAAGTIYCANTGSRTVIEYPRRGTSASLTITMPQFLTPENLAIDRSGNLYVSYLGGPKYSGVMEFPPGSTTGTDLGLTIGLAGALEVDRAGNVIVIDSNVNTIDVFPPGQTTPSKQIPVAAGLPFELSLNRDENVLYATVQASGGFIVQDVSYPNGSGMSNVITANDGNWPLAVSPDAVL